MPIINVVKRFMLNSDDHKLTEYLVGRYEVEQAIADHWYVQAHCEGFVEPPPPTGTDQQAVLLAQQAARLNEAPATEAQPPAEAPVTAPAAKRENRFAGRREIPKDDPTPSFIDPAKR